MAPRWELKVIGHTAGNGGNKRALEVGAVEWNAATSTPVTGFYYLRARYHDPATGRFLNRDVYRGRARRPASQNLFAYVQGNPVSYADPRGRDREGCNGFATFASHRMAGAACAGVPSDTGPSCDTIGVCISGSCLLG